MRTWHNKNIQSYEICLFKKREASWIIMEGLFQSVQTLDPQLTDQLLSYGVTNLKWLPPWKMMMIENCSNYDVNNFWQKNFQDTKHNHNIANGTCKNILVPWKICWRDFLANLFSVPFFLTISAQFLLLRYTLRIRQC